MRIVSTAWRVRSSIEIARSHCTRSPLAAAAGPRTTRSAEDVVRILSSAASVFSSRPEDEDLPSAGPVATIERRDYRPRPAALGCVSVLDAQSVLGLDLHDEWSPRAGQPRLDLIQTPRSSGWAGRSGLFTACCRATIGANRPRRDGPTSADAQYGGRVHERTLRRAGTSGAARSHRSAGKPRDGRATPGERRSLADRPSQARRHRESRARGYGPQTRAAYGRPREERLAKPFVPQRGRPTDGATSRDVRRKEAHHGRNRSSSHPRAVVERRRHPRAGAEIAQRREACREVSCSRAPGRGPSGSRLGRDMSSATSAERERSSPTRETSTASARSTGSRGRHAAGPGESRRTRRTRPPRADEGESSARERGPRFEEASVARVFLDGARRLAPSRRHPRARDREGARSLGAASGPGLHPIAPRASGVPGERGPRTTREGGESRSLFVECYEPDTRAAYSPSPDLAPAEDRARAAFETADLRSPRPRRGDSRKKEARRRPYGARQNELPSSSLISSSSALRSRRHSRARKLLSFGICFARRDRQGGRRAIGLLGVGTPRGAKGRAAAQGLYEHCRRSCVVSARRHGEELPPRLLGRRATTCE